MRNTHTLLIPRGYKFAEEYAPSFDIDKTALITIKIVPDIPVPKYILIKPYQIRVGDKIVEIPAGTGVLEVPQAGYTTLITNYNWDKPFEGLQGNKPLKKKVVENNPEYFKLIENDRH